MELSKKTTIKSFTLLLALLAIIHIPSFQHEYGMDSFVIHVLANAVSTFGYAKWWLSPLSIFGLYPYSICSTVPFALSGISQTVGIDVETTILLLCIILGFFTFFASYIMAGAILNNALFKLLVAFGISISPAALNYLTWTMAARAPFIALLPLFIYLLLKSRDYRIRCGLLTFILFVFLLATHHLAYFLIPPIIGYLIVLISYKVKRLDTFKRIKVPEYYSTFTLIIVTSVALLIPFFTRRLMEAGSRYVALTSIFLGNFPRYAGLLGVFAISGFIYLLFKQNKEFGEWCLLFFTIFLIPFFYVETYIKWVLPCFVLPLAGISLINISHRNRKRKWALIIIVIALVLSVSFSGFYQHWRTQGGLHKFDGYISDSTYATGIWVNENVQNGTTVANDVNKIGIRVFAISEVPHFIGYYNSVDLAYDLVNISELNLIKKPITDEDFWYNGPYILIDPYSSRVLWAKIMTHSYAYYLSKYSSDFKFTHLIENKNIHGAMFFEGTVMPSQFLNSVKMEKDNIYENGAIGIWYLG